MGKRAASVGLLLALSISPSAAQEQGAPSAAPKTLFERYTQPIDIYKTGLGHVHAPDLVVQQGSAGVLRPGLSDDVRVRQARGGAVVPRIVEARSELRDLLLGRSVGVGVVPERDR